jgi:carbamoyl-phosphate synthase large subunit
MKWISGNEYTLDLYIDRAGQTRAVVPRRRLEVRAGEVSKSRIEMRESVVQAGHAVACAMAAKGAWGVLNVQCIETEDEEVYFIEINPRFGGGCPLSIQAGYNFPKWLIQEALGWDIGPIEVPDADGLTMLRYDDAIFVRT